MFIILIHDFIYIYRYHVPRSFMNEGVNTLVLLEEFGGNPTLVNFQTVRPGTICGNVNEKNTLELSCQGKPISEIKFASFGTPEGTCGSFQKGTCEGSKDALSVLHTVSTHLSISSTNFGRTCYFSLLLHQHA